MTVRTILLYATHKKNLRKKSVPVVKFDQQVQRVIGDLKDTLQAHSDGVGLAAPQINIHQRVVIVCLGTEINGQWKAGPAEALINPQIIDSADQRKDFDGCLSFPGLYGETVRPHFLRVKGLNEQGQSFNHFFQGFNAVVVHHEIDHLNGVLFIDRIKNMDDLYTIRTNEKDEVVKVPYRTRP